MLHQKSETRSFVISKKQELLDQLFSQLELQGRNPKDLSFEEMALFIIYRCKCGWERERHQLLLSNCPNCGVVIPKFEEAIEQPPGGKQTTFYIRNHRQLSTWRLLLDKIDGSSPIRYFLYGGAVGGGKSYLIRWANIGLLIKWFEHFGIRAQTMIACEDYPTLQDRHISKLPYEIPQWLGEYNKQEKILVLKPEWGGGSIAFRNLDDPSKYQSAEFAAISVDELTKNDYSTFNWLRTRIRWPGLEEGPFLGATNPGGPGHVWVKQLWKDKNFPPELRAYAGQFHFIPAKATDNPMLPASYWADLQSLPEEMRRALVEGDWDFFMGQALPELRRDIHGWDAKVPIPDTWERFMAMDWNYSRPLSLGWYAINEDEFIVRYREFYGMQGNSPDIGLRMTPAEVAQKILEIEEAEGEEISYRVAGNDIFAPMSDGGPPIAEQFEEAGVFFDPIDLKGLGMPDRKRTRIFGKIQLHKRLQDGSFKISLEGCPNFWRTVPSLALDKNNPEDVDTKQEDHIFDEVRYALMSRPIFIGEPEKEMTDQEKIDAIVKGRMDESGIDSLFVTDEGQALLDDY
ncbi:MAG: hypothetical protein GTN76_09230 [Candidatus Aenigmarchaeota archaeon]|nr:hypothetical protein [Candidatus Aenigmarchaeota archaeon]